MDHEIQAQASLSVSLILFIAYPFIVHAGVLTGVSWPALALLTLLLILQFQPMRTLHQSLLAVSVALTLAWLVKDSADIVLYAPPLLIILLLLGLFTRSLLPGNKPLISRIAQLMHKEPSAELLRYTRAVTIGWVIFLSLMLLEVIGLTLFTSQEQWSLFTNFYNYLFMAVFFLLEFILRRFFVAPSERMSLRHFFYQLYSIDYRKLFRQQ